MSNRELATKELLYFIDQFAPGSPNRDIYEKRLEAMSNKQFDTFMKKLESGEEILALWIANLDKHRIDLKRNLKIAKQLDYDFWQHLTLTDPETGQVYTTKAKHMVVDLPLRRQVQMLYKKMSVPEDNKKVDERTGQPTGESKGASLSYPELQVNAAKGLDAMITELIKFRGGDVKAFNAMNRSIMQTGSVDLKSLENIPTKVKATETLSVMLKSMMIDNNL